MKNKKIWIILGIVLILVGGCFITYKLLNKSYSNVQTITVSEFVQKINNKESFVLVLSQTGCSHCKQYLPELNRTLKKINFTAYELNITNMSGEDGSTLNKIVNFSGTPTTVFYRDGVESTTLNRINGYANGDKVLERLKSLGYIE